MPAGSAPRGRTRVGLDDFKGINEQFTYQVGHQLLLALSRPSHNGRLGA